MQGFALVHGRPVVAVSALDALAHLPEDQVCIAAFNDSIGMERLRRQLGPWLPGGTYGHLFSSTVDNFEVSSNTCIEMVNLLLDRWRHSESDCLGRFGHVTCESGLSGFN